MRTVLFVCTGNTCRSPMAEAIADHWLRELATDDRPGGEPDWLVSSAGIAAGDGAPVASEAIAALAAMGIPHDGRSKQLTAAMIRGADLILGMTEGHVAAARSLVADSPADARKVRSIDPSGDIEDPIGLGQDVYNEVARRMQELVPARLRELFVEEPSS